MKTGNIVEVKNAYFKNDNGLYFVRHSPGDPSWSGKDYSLNKLKKNGEISTAKHNIAFWPLSAFTNNREKNRAARIWNAENATIEILAETNDHVKQFFKNEAETVKQRYEKDLAYYGDIEHVKLTKTIYEFYEEIGK